MEVIGDLMISNSHHLFIIAYHALFIVFFIRLQVG